MSFRVMLYQKMDGLLIHMNAGREKILFEIETQIICHAQSDFREHSRLSRHAVGLCVR